MNSGYLTIQDGQDDDFTGATRKALAEQRIRQDFFRRMVVSSYGTRCCMSGIADERLLVASHIVPWKADKQNRLNPSNGLCLSALHDRAFDRGLISLTDDFCVLVSKSLIGKADPFTRATFSPLHGKAITLPERFLPEPRFIAHHREHIFLDA